MSNNNTELRIWTTRDGRTIPIDEMETSHIKNCLKMLRKNYIGANEISSMLNFNYEAMGDAAQMAFDQALDEASVLIPCPEIDWFVEELNRRGENPYE